MIRALLQGPLPRLVSVGIVLVAFQVTLFAEMRPLDVAVQVVLLLAAAAGAGAGPQKGALAGFVLGLMYDLRVGTPLGSSSISMGLGGFAAGYVTTITVDPQWWLAAIFTAVGAAVGEAAVPVVRAFVGEEAEVSSRLVTILPVMAVAGFLSSPVLVPVGRWCMRVKRQQWKAMTEA